MTQTDLIARQEWTTLQNQYDSYEKHSLLIKLLNVVLMSSMFIFGYHGVWGIALIVILWLQDSIWKTFQQRIENRLLAVEKMLASNEQEDGMQFNSSWQESRPGTIGLVVEYLSQSIRPTVAFPHALLVAIALLAGPSSIIG